MTQIIFWSEFQCLLSEYSNTQKWDESANTSKHFNVSPRGQTDIPDWWRLLSRIISGASCHLWVAIFVQPDPCNLLLHCSSDIYVQYVYKVSGYFTAIRWHKLLVCYIVQWCTPSLSLSHLRSISFYIVLDKWPFARINNL